MSPTSSEPSGSGASRAAARAPDRLAAHSRQLRAEREQRRFRRLFWMLSAGLAVAAAVLLGVSSLQGPRLSSATVDTTRVTEQPAQQLRLFANQPLADIDAAQVVVTPETPVSTTVDGALLVVQFEQRLHTDTEYTVEVRDVTAVGRGASSTIEHRFTTAPGELVYLDRGETVDEVLRAPLAGAGRGEVVHAAEGIQHMAPVEGVLVLARDAAGGTSVLESVQTSSGVVQNLRLPDGVRVDALIAPPVGTLLGVVFSSAPLEGEQQGVPEYASTLGVVDLAGDGTVAVVPGLDGGQLAVDQGWFLPDGTTMIVHGRDQTVQRVELLTGLVLPIDQVPTAYGISSDATRLTGADAFGGIIVDLDSGEQSRLDPSPLEGEFAFGGEALLTAGELRVQKIAIPDASGGVFRSALIADDGSGASRLLYRTPDDRGSLGELSLSPNDQYVAIEVTPSVEDAQNDGRVVNSRPTSITLVIVDVASGVVVRTLEGFSPRW